MCENAAFFLGNRYTKHISAQLLKGHNKVHLKRGLFELDMTIVFYYIQNSKMQENMYGI